MPNLSSDIQPFDPYFNTNSCVQNNEHDNWLATHFINPNPTPSEIADRRNWIIKHNQMVENNLRSGMEPSNNNNDRWLATHFINPNPTPNEIAAHNKWITEHNRTVAKNLNIRPPGNKNGCQII